MIVHGAWSLLTLPANQVRFVVMANRSTQATGNAKLC